MTLRNANIKRNRQRHESKCLCELRCISLTALFQQYFFDIFLSTNIFASATINYEILSFHSHHSGRDGTFGKFNKIKIPEKYPKGNIIFHHSRAYFCLFIDAINVMFCVKTHKMPTLDALGKKRKEKYEKYINCAFRVSRSAYQKMVHVSSLSKQ